VLSPISPLFPVSPTASANKLQGAQTTPSGSFAKQLNDALAEVNSMQVKADDMAAKLVLGEIDDIHQVTIAMEKAALSLQLAVQVRNKVVEAYQEIARMQV